MTPNFKPLHDRVLVQAAAAEEKTASGIIIPDTAKEKPMRGTVIAAGPGKKDEPLTVQAGDTVTQGQPLAVMEAMKMEHTIAAPMDGVVQELLYAPGDQVAEGAELLKLVAAEVAEA